MHADRSRHGLGIRRDWAVPGLVAIFMLASAAPAAQAQQSPWVTETQSDADWIVTLGGYGDLEPKFEGARHHTFWFHPIIDYRTVGSREWLSLPNDGFDFPLIVTDSFRAGPAFNGRWSLISQRMQSGGQRIDGPSQLVPASPLPIEPSCGATIPSMRSNPLRQACRPIRRRRA